MTPWIMKYQWLDRPDSIHDACIPPDILCFQGLDEKRGYHSQWQDTAISIRECMMLQFTTIV
jgi:hypothetical protein